MFRREFIVAFCYRRHLRSGLFTVNSRFGDDVATLGIDYVSRSSNHKQRVVGLKVRLCGCNKYLFAIS